MISVIILTWNSKRYIENCVKSLLIDIDETREDAEILIIDGGSADGTLEILDQLKKRYPNINPIKLGKNLGTTISRNIGIRRSSGEYIFFLDSDTEIQLGTLKTLIDVIKENERIGIAAPRLLYPDREVQPSCKKFPTIVIKVCKFQPFKWLREWGERAELYDPRVYDKSFNRVIEVDHCISAAWLVRRAAIEEVGLFDENIFYAPEDVDLCLRMWLSGWKVVYVPTATVIHHTQRASYKNLKVAWKHAKGLFYYFRKHKYGLNRRRLYRKIAKEGDWPQYPMVTEFV